MKNSCQTFSQSAASMTGIRRLGRTMQCALFFLAIGASALAADVPKEYQIKAAFLYNFTKFVEWPPQRFRDADSPIVIGILGHNPFGDQLEKIVAGRQVNGHRIVVRALTSAAEAREVHIVFVAGAEESQSKALGELLQASGTVTVSDSSSSARGAAVIVFTLEGDKVRFVIDQNASERAGVKLSAQLLKLATVVRKKGRTRTP